MSPARFRLALALLPAVVTLVVISLAFRNARVLGRDNDWVEHTRQVLERSDALLLQVMDAELRQRGYLVTGDSASLVPAQGTRERAERVLAELERLTADNTSQRPRLAALERELPVGFDLLARGATFRHRGTLDSLTHMALLREGRQHIERVRDLVGAVKNEEQRLLEERQAASSRQTRLASAVLVLGGALAVVIAILVNVFLTRIIDESERMSRELGAQLDDLVAVRRELDARTSSEG